MENKNLILNYNESEEDNNSEIINFEEGLKMEIDNLFEEIDIDEEFKKAQNISTSNIILSDCSKLIPSLQINEYVIGPYNSLLIRSINTFVPDLFRVCWFVPGIGVPEICPTIDNIIRTIFFNQTLIDENLLKAFLYFGFSSDINTNYGITVPSPKSVDYYDLSLFLKNFYKNLFTEDIDNFYDFTNHFFQRYKNNTLLSQLIFFRFIINRAHENTTLGKVNCPYIVPWNATAVCRGFQLYDLKAINYTLDITLLNNIYTLFNTWLGNVQVLGTSVESGNTLLQYVQNFFLVLLYTGQVFEDIVVEFSYRITKKCYCKKPYMSLQYFQKCKELYQIYIENKKRLG